MKNRKFAKKFGCILLATSLVLSGTNIPATSQAKTIAKYYNTKKTITFKDPKGIRKCLVNGKAKKIKAGTKKIKITFKKEGKYVVKITNRKKKVTTKTVYIDKTAPTITGVKNGKNYTDAVSFAAKDKYGMSSFKVNGTKIKAPYKATVTETGTYELLAEDKAGNVRKLSFVISAGQPEATSGTAVSSGAMATTGPATNSQIPNAPALLPGNDNPGSPVLPGSDNSNSGTQDKIPTIGCNHLWILQSVEEEATCYSPGIAKYTCFSCGGTKRDELPKVAHDYSKLIADKRYEIKKEKCEETGEYYLCCKYCGEKGTEIGTVDALGHEYKKRISSSDYLKEPATLEHGNIYYLACMHCGEKGNDTWDDGALITHTEHTFTDTSVADDSNRATDATCTKPATYYYKCTGCNTFDTENKEHTFESGDPLGHEFSIRTLKEEATCEHGNLYDRKCSRPNCEEYEGKIEDDKKTIPHDFKEIATLDHRKEPEDCSNPAQYIESCSMCGTEGKKLFYYGEKKAHHFIRSDKKIASEADCTKPRMYYTTCEFCDEQGADTYASNKKDEQAKGHDPVKIEHSDYDAHDHATCAHGTVYYWGCRNCKFVDTSQTWTADDILSHDYKETNEPQYLHMIPKGDATCTEPAKYYKVCTMCHQPSNSLDSIFSHGNPKGHDYSVKTIIKAATPTENQTYRMKCSRCDAFQTTNTVEDPNTYTDKTGPSISWTGYNKNGEPTLYSQNPVNKDFIFYGVAPGTASFFYATFNVTDTGGSGLKTVKSIEATYNIRPEAIDPYTHRAEATDVSEMFRLADNSWANYTLVNFTSSAVGQDNEYSGTSAKKYMSIQGQTLDMYGYVYIYAEDWAGNVTIVRTSDLIPNAFGSKKYN